MRLVFKQDVDSLQLMTLASDWGEAIGAILLAKACMPSGKAFWLITDTEFEVLKDTPIEAWEVSGEPDGIGGLSEEEMQEYKTRVEEFQRGSNYQQYEIDRAQRASVGGQEARVQS